MGQEDADQFDLDIKFSSQENSDSRSIAAATSDYPCPSFDYCPTNPCVTVNCPTETVTCHRHGPSPC
jgi:hypothetical protein